MSDVIHCGSVGLTRTILLESHSLAIEGTWLVNYNVQVFKSSSLRLSQSVSDVFVLRSAKSQRS